jgi:hypothetical protein
MSLNSTGVVIRDRDTGKEYGFHADCGDEFLNVIGNDALTGRFVILEPLFADPSEWVCAYTDCLHK